MSGAKLRRSVSRLENPFSHCRAQFNALSHYFECTSSGRAKNRLSKWPMQLYKRFWRPSFYYSSSIRSELHGEPRLYDAFNSANKDEHSGQVWRVGAPVENLGANIYRGRGG